MAVNLHSLAIVTGKSQSSINGLLKLLGYAIGPRSHGVRDELVHTWPIPQGDGRELCEVPGFVLSGEDQKQLRNVACEILMEE
jgi:hypothetical protein